MIRSILEAPRGWSAGVHGRIFTDRDKSASASPNILNLISVSPSRSGSRAMRDRLAIITGRDPAALIGPRALAVVHAGGLPAALAIGHALAGWRDPDADGDETSHRRLALAVVGTVLLDGICDGPLYSAWDRREAHAWAEDLEQLLKIGPADPGDEGKLDHAELIADVGSFDLRDLDRLLRAAFALVERAAPIHVPNFVDADFIALTWRHQASLFELFDDAPELDAPITPRSFSPRRRSPSYVSDPPLPFI